jgi:hypothetical protein
MAATIKARRTKVADSYLALVREFPLVSIKSEPQLREAQVELRETVRNLDRCWGELVDQARKRLGDLFDVTDYLQSIADEFEITWDYPATTPPDYLRSVAPENYDS